MITKTFTAENIRKVGNKSNPSYVISIPKYLIKEGLFNIDRKTSVILTQEGEDNEGTQKDASVVDDEAGKQV
jgi:hypothetical protein